MTRISKIQFLSVAAATGLTAIQAGAQNTHYAPGDLVLFFQKAGSTNTVYADLGNAATVFRGAAAGADAPNKVKFLDLNSVLTSAFGAGWANDTGIYAGLAGVYDSTPTGSTLQDGDPFRTLYVSAARNSVGTVGAANSTARDMFTAGNTAMTDAASGIEAMNNVFETQYDAQATVSLTGISQIDDQNPFLSPGIQSPAMGGALDGGIQQAGTSVSFGTMGYAGSVEFALDLYRVLAKNTVSGQVGGALRFGSFEGTVTVGTDGMVSFLTAPTAFDTWALGYPALDTDAKRQPTADPDGDGVNNLYEFGFGGNPGSATDRGTPQSSTLDANGDSQGDITLTIQVRSGATFTQVGNGDMTATMDNVTYLVEGSTDLADWSSPILPVTPAVGSGSPAAGYEFKTFRLQAGNGLAGKGFIRASATK